MLALVLAAVAAQAPTSGSTAAPERRTRLTVGPWLPLGYLPLELETAISPGVSVAVGAQFAFPALPALTGASAAGVGGSISLRYFTAGRAPRGFWLGPELMAGLFALASPTTAVGQIYAGPVAMLGYTFIADDGFTISAGGGIGPGLAISLRDDLVSPAYLAPLYRLHLSLGYAW